MTPICIVTRNRHAILDVTLRSLSASDLPEDQVLIVFDDGSDHPVTLKYLYSDTVVPVYHRWPASGKYWQSMLGDVKSKPSSAGLSGRVRVVRMSKRQRGVVNASCDAFYRMVRKYGPEQGILILQDDAVFNTDWFRRLQAAEQKPVQDGRPVGLIAGCWINKGNAEHRRAPMTLVPNGGVTAQCYYVTPAGIAAVMPWASKEHAINKGFDNKFCAAVRESTDIYRMHPAVCQHIGTTSIVRPQWAWHKWNSKGRVDFSARGPYPLAEHVRSFKE